jgi:type II secretory pathway component GspD/PulD (secretin)
LAQQIRIWDRPEDQIQINTYVVEISRNDDLFGGVDWSNTLGQCVCLPGEMELTCQKLD